MSNELTIRPNAGITIRNVDELARIADMMAKSGYFTDARSAAQAGVKIMAGQGWGIQPFDAMTGIHIIEGKPSVGAGLMAARVKGSGRYDYRVRDMSDKECRIEFFEGGESIGVSAFTIEDAKAAGVAFKTSKGYPTSWAKFPRNMLFARAMSNGVRWYCPDVFSTPVYTAEELGAEVDGEGNVIDVTHRAAPERQIEAPVAPARKNAIADEPITEGITAEQLAESADAAPWGDDQGGMFPPEEDLPAEVAAEPGITPSQLKAIHTRLTKLGFNGKQADKDLAREFIGHMVGRALESSKDLTKTEAGTLLDLDDDTLADALDAFKVERQMAAEGAA